ncbi:hypothetical protein I4U23_022309 [Adineta vaga]|nr:hypothetical protein I4U23_022309 [Adineta vaga]
MFRLTICTFIFVLLITAVRAPGGGGGGGGGGGYRGGFISGGGRSRGAIGNSTNDGISPRNNTDFIHDSSPQNISQMSDPFKTGIWSFNYYQYGKSHGPYRMSLQFNHSSSIVTGRGTYDVGDFTMDGVFSSENFRLGINQRYIEGTGDANENLGHTSILQMAWNSNQNQFEGKWYVKTHKYTGNGNFHLRFEKTAMPLLYDDSAC